MEYLSVSEAAKKWGISDRHIRVLCTENKIDGVMKEGRSYLIPADALKTADARRNKAKEIAAAYAPLFARVDALREELNYKRPSKQGELKRLQEQFLVEFTYHSNAIEHLLQLAGRYFAKGVAADDRMDVLTEQIYIPSVGFRVDFIALDVAKLEIRAIPEQQMDVIREFFTYKNRIGSNGYLPCNFLTLGSGEVLVHGRPSDLYADVICPRQRPLGVW